MKVKYKKIHERAVKPYYATSGAAGMDLFAVDDVDVSPGETKLIRTGLIVSFPQGYELQVRPRSGLSLKTYLRVANSPGTIDSDFRGELCVIVQNSDFRVRAEVIQIKAGDRIAQAVIAPVIIAEWEEAWELDQTERGEGGYGHTGR